MKKTLSTLIAAALMAFVSTTYAADAATGKGTVNSVDMATASLNMSHEAIPAIKWPAMTMDFKVADKKVLTSIKAGEKVTFGLVKEPSAGYVISHIEPAK